MSSEYDAMSEEQFFGGVAYGSGYEVPWEGEVAPQGTLRLVHRIANATVNYPASLTSTKSTVTAFAGSNTPSGSLLTQYLSGNVALASSMPLSGNLTRSLGKFFSGSISPKTNDTDNYDAANINVFDEYDFLSPNSFYVRHIDGLIKRVSTKKTSGVTPQGSLVAKKNYRQSGSGSITPTSTLSTTLYTMYYLGHPGAQTPISSGITPSGSLSALLQDPNDMNYLAIQNSQKVIPKVNAYWANGRFTQNLFGLSSSDLYQKKTSAMNPSLYLKFDELKDTPATIVCQDSSINNYDGIYVGTKSSVVGALQGNDAGLYSLSLSGSGYVSIADNADINPTDNFQIECWLKLSGTPASTQYVYSKAQGSTNTEKQYALSANTDRTLSAYAYSGSSAFSATTTTALTVGEWYHVIFSIKNNKLSIILNGEEEDNDTLSGDVNDTNGPLEIGRFAGGSEYFVGAIDEFAFYNVASLSASGGAYARYRSGVNGYTSQWYEQFYPEQIMNGFSRVSYVWGVTDTNKLNGDPITANGEVYVMESDNSYRYEHGWWSRSTSDPLDGKMNFIETVVCEFDEHPCTQIDVFTSEFFAGVKEFDLYYKNSSDVWVLLVSGATIDIDEYLNTTPFASLTQIKGIRVDIHSIWANGDVARIEEIDPTYVTDISEDIISFSIDTDRENFDSNIPIGSSSANSFSMELSNIALDYSLYNAAGPYYNLILPDVKFEVELAWFGAITDDNPTGYNYNKLGTFWADEWQESSDSMTVQVNSRDYSKFLQETTAVGNVWLDIDGPDAVANLLKETNFPVYDIEVDLPYDTTCIRNDVAGLWMFHEQQLTKYALSWNEEIKKQTAVGKIQHGPTGSFTLMFWLNSNASVSTAPTSASAVARQSTVSSTLASTQTIVHFFNSASNYVHVQNPKAITLDISGSTVNTGVNVADGIWHQVSISWNETSGGCNLYVDGILKYTGTVGVGKILTGTGYALSLGAPQTSKTIVPTPTQYSNSQFVGQIGYILLWDDELTANQIRDKAFREVNGLEKDMLLSFTGYNGPSEQLLNSTYIISKAYSQDYLKLVDVSFVQTGFMNFKDYAGLHNASPRGNVEYAQTEHAISLEPFNQSLLLTGDRPTHVYFSGAGSVYTPGAYRVSIKEDIDIFLQVSVPTFTPTSEQILYSQSKPSTNQRALVVALTTGGAIKVSYSTNGTSFTTVTTTATLQSKDLRPYEKFWLRISHDINNGASGNDISVYISTQDIDAASIASWSLVEKKTTASVLASGRYASNANVVIGSDADGNNKFKGNVYSVYVTSGINSKDSRINIVENNYNTTLATSFVDNEKNTWTLSGSIMANDLGSYVEIPPSDSLDVAGGSFAIGLWVNPVANENYVLLSNENAGTPQAGSFSVVLTSSGAIGVVKKNGTQWSPSSIESYGVGMYTVSGKVTAGNWNFIAISYDADTEYLQIYVNGDRCKNSIFAGGFTASSNSWLLGTDADRRFFCGKGIYVSGLGIFDKALSEAQWRTIYRSGASLVNNRFPVIWTEEGETLWDAMLAVSTGDLGTFYFDYDNKFVYSNALNNYSSAYEEFAIPQWYFDDDKDIISASQSIALQTNKVVIKLTSEGVDFNKKQGLWKAPDNLQLAGGELSGNITATFVEFLEYKSKIIQTGGEPVTIPYLLPSGNVKVNDEIIYYDRRDENRLYDLRRGQFGTTPADHAAGDRLREVRAFNIEYSTKPAIVLEDPFISAVIFEKTVDIDVWKPDAFGAKLVISRNTSGDDPYFVQVLSSTDALNNTNNFISVSGVVFANPDSAERDEYESAEYADNIRRYGLKQVEITNRFIYSHYAAKKYADYLLQHFAEPVSIINVAILGNPMVKLGNRVRISTLDRMSISTEDYWIESNSIRYSGGIEQDLVLRKVI